MTMPASISVRNLSLSVPTYVQGDRRAGGWASLLWRAAVSPPRREFVTLLEDIDFDVRSGERVAILGRNGAGKSTLLRVLNKVYAPTRGSLHVSGACQALLNISLGFNGDATLRENIYLRGTAMGMLPSALRRETGAILEFAALEDKAGHRLRTLSAGQRLRLGFAIATSVQQDIMLMDEWLGAGDAEFLDRARERMRSRVFGSEIVMLASHSIPLLRDICTRGIVLEAGRVVFHGDIQPALQAYHRLMAERRELQSVDPTPAEEASRAAGVYGFVEQLEIEPGRLRVRGWFADTDGDIPSSLAAEVLGTAQLADRLDSVRRPDVTRHLGLHEDHCGFAAEFVLADGVDPGQVARELVILGGNGDRPETPLKLAASVRQFLERVAAG
jgi:ABC-type polysaccharide/polyol phosphate transport system ATPase subunit